MILIPEAVMTDKQRKPDELTESDLDAASGGTTNTVDTPGTVAAPDLLADPRPSPILKLESSGTEDGDSKLK